MSFDKMANDPSRRQPAAVTYLRPDGSIGCAPELGTDRPKLGSVPICGSRDQAPAREDGPAEPGRVRLTRPGSLDVDQAELFLLSLDMEMTTADQPRVAYLLGLCEGHLANMIELVRAVTR